MPELPHSALHDLETGAERFSEKPLKGKVLYKLTLPDVRGALAVTQRQARADQVPAALGSPRHRRVLMILRMGEFADLAAGEGERMTTNGTLDSGILLIAAVVPSVEEIADVMPSG
jgi:hypothetical protein